MTSSDNQQYITVELFNSKMETILTQIKFGNEQLRNELREEFKTNISDLRSEIHTGFATLQTQTQVNSAKIEMLQHTFYWGFAIMAAIIALIPYFRREKKLEDKSTHTFTTEERVREIIAETIGNIKTVEK